MKFGLTGRAGGFELCHPGEVPNMARMGEEMGFYSIWMQEEHFIPPGGESVCLSPQVLGAAIAARTFRIRIGFSVILLPLHSPLRLSEDIATLDSISNGRVDFGVSGGFPGKYFEAYGVSSKTRRKQFRSNLKFIVDCWTQEPKMIDRKKYSIQPKPVQKPHPPIYVATYNEDNARWTARNGHHLIQHGIQSPSHLSTIVRAFEQAGGKVDEIPVSRFVYVSQDANSATREIRPTVHKLTAFLKRIKISSHGFLSEKDLDPDRFIEEMVISGGPREVIERISYLKESLGIDYLNSLIAFYGCLPFENMMKSMKRMSDQVLPELES